MFEMIDEAKTYIHKPTISKKLPPFYRLVLEAYPEFDSSSSVFWKKMIHNYKHAIYTLTYEKYSRVWNKEDYGFKDINIIVDKHNIMRVTFSEGFVEDLETFYPENKL